VTPNNASPNLRSRVLRAELWPSNGPLDIRLYFPYSLSCHPVGPDGFAHVLSLSRGCLRAIRRCCGGVAAAFPGAHGASVLAAHPGGAGLPARPRCRRAHAVPHRRAGCAAPRAGPAGAAARKASCLRDARLPIPGRLGRDGLSSRPRWLTAPGDEAPAAHRARSGQDPAPGPGAQALPRARLCQLRALRRGEGRHLAAYGTALGADGAPGPGGQRGGGRVSRRAPHAEAGVSRLGGRASRAAAGGHRLRAGRDAAPARRRARRSRHGARRDQLHGSPGGGQRVSPGPRGGPPRILPPLEGRLSSRGEGNLPDAYRT